jgi:hypothetical protein
MKIIPTHFSPIFSYILPLMPKYLPLHRILKDLRLCPSHPYERTGKILVLYYDTAENPPYFAHNYLQGLPVSLTNHAIKVYRGSGGAVQFILNFGLEGEEWLGSRSHCSGN